ncbi:signal-transducing histidine kinase [Halobiforma nitratireducens JCM 10879]|uniref:histidine kinase n=1 Tax=Halobiforma nitratireducens JCM 10879 TaxID=1227454 RepID=M0M4I3_9EURY|nr:signal-transducing histidine kinase [Halobiforma nitratireducens JCM 10879]
MSLKLTNPIHGLYFTTSETTASFQYLAVEHGVLHWSATGLSYVLAAIGLFMIFELYVRSEYDTRPLGILTVLLGLPVVFDIVAIATPRLINFIYAPIGVAIFAVGVLLVFQERLLAVRTALPGSAASIYLDGDRRITDVSDEVVKLFPGIERAIGDPLSEALPEATPHLEAEGSIFELSKNDDMRYYLVETNPVGLADSEAQVLSFTDVTRLEKKRRQLHRRERELDTQNELYRAVLAASFDFVYRMDPDGRLTFVSPSVEDALGYEPEALVGDRADRLTPTNEASDQAHRYLDDVLDGESLQIQDFQLEHHDGKRVYADIRVVPIYEPGISEEERTAETIVGAQGMVRETMERHRRESLISVINRVLRHNVRNKLTIINGYAGRLSNDLDGKAATNADQIVDTADSLIELTESAREIAQVRSESYKLESHNVVPILDGVVTEIEEQYPNASISVDTPESAVAQTLPKIETAFVELLDNAAKHSGESPSIDLEVAVGTEWVTVTIADDGPGLPENERQALSVGTEEPLAHGSGLGLWLIYWVVTTLDGDIEVLEADQGTTVTINLPKSDL